MQDNILTWSIKNWITVFIMFMLAWAVVGFAGRLVIGSFVKKQPDNTNTAAGAFVK